MLLRAVFLIYLVPVCSGLVPFVCIGGDICNRDQTEQYCDTTIKRCMDCSEYSCSNCALASNCTTFCQALENRRRNETIEEKLKEAKKSNCALLPPIPNGNISSGNTGHGSVVKVHCDTGHILVGPFTLTCGDYGVWSSKLPMCKEITCAQPPGLQHGDWNVSPQQIRRITPSLSQGNLNVGTVMSFTCHDGYTLEGCSLFVCSKASTWEPVGETCDKTLPACHSPTPPCKENAWKVASVVMLVVLVIAIIAAIAVWRFVLGGQQLTQHQSDSSLNSTGVSDNDKTSSATSANTHRGRSADNVSQTATGDSDETSTREPTQTTAETRKENKQNNTGSTSGSQPTSSNMPCVFLVNNINNNSISQTSCGVQTVNTSANNAKAGSSGKGHPDLTRDGQESEQEGQAEIRSETETEAEDKPGQHTQPESETKFSTEETKFPEQETPDGNERVKTASTGPTVKIPLPSDEERSGAIGGMDRRRSGNKTVSCSVRQPGHVSFDQPIGSDRDNEGSDENEPEYGDDDNSERKSLLSTQTVNPQVQNDTEACIK